MSTRKTTYKSFNRPEDSEVIDQDDLGDNWEDLSTSLFGGGVTGSRPASPDRGDTYYDTTLSAFVMYTGSAWVEVLGRTLTQTLTNKTLTSPALTSPVLTTPQPPFAFTPLIAACAWGLK